MVDRYRYPQRLGRTGQAFRDVGTSFGDLFEGLSYGRRYREEKEKEKRVYDLQRRQLGDVPITQAEMYQMLEGTNVPYGADISDILPQGVEKDPYGNLWKRTPKKTTAKKYVSVPIWINGKKVPMRLPDDEKFNLTIDRLSNQFKDNNVSFEAPKEIVTLQDSKDSSIKHYSKEAAEALKMSDPKRYQTYEEMEAKLKPDQVLRKYYNKETGEHIETKFVDKKQVNAVDKIMSKKGFVPDKPKMSKVRWIDAEENYREEMVPETQYNAKVSTIEAVGGRLKDQAKSSFEMGYEVWREKNPDATREEYRREWLIEPGKLSENQVTDNLLNMVNYDNEAFSKLYDIYLDQRDSGKIDREVALNWVSNNVDIISLDEGGYEVKINIKGSEGLTEEESVSKGKYIWGE